MPVGDVFPATAQRLARALPDTPRWVDTRGITRGFGEEAPE
jgi:hypothetical protein